jgi:hypothetical protein
MGNQHNDSMGDQGSWHHLEVVGTEMIRIPSGVTNVLLVGSSTPVVTRFLTRERSGRKIRFAARSDSDAVAFTEGENIATIGSSASVGALDTIEFMCTPAADGTLSFVQSGLSNIT